MCSNALAFYNLLNKYQYFLWWSKKMQSLTLCKCIRLSCNRSMDRDRGTFQLVLNHYCLKLVNIGPFKIVWYHLDWPACQVPIWFSCQHFCCFSPQMLPPHWLGMHAYHKALTNFEFKVVLLTGCQPKLQGPVYPAI